jgi:Tol biopolymer transport system component
MSMSAYQRRLVVSAVPLLLLLIGCYGVDMAAAGKSAPSKPPYAADEPITDPKLFAEGVINTDADTYGPTFTPDGKSLYFAKRIKRGELEHIFVSHFVGGKWGEPRVAEFSGKFFDKEPFISPDGSRLFFSSNRPVEGETPNKDFDIWVVRRAGRGWGAPEHLGAPVGVGGDDDYPSVAANGTLYFGSTREGGKGRVDLYRVRRVKGKYRTAENLGDAINTPETEADPYIAPDESYLIFTSTRPGGFGRGDLYISFNRKGVWTTPKNLGAKVNTDVFDYTPLVTPDGKYLFFSRAWGKIYQIDFGALGISP